MDAELLKEELESRKSEIRQRLQEFQQVREEADDARLFEELSFCVLTANTSAKMGIESIKHIKPVLMKADEKELAKKLKGVYRFYNIRSEYIVHNRNYLEEEHDFQIRKLLESFDNAEEARDFIVDNIKGIGYKEGSHFLRNIGYKDLAILDKHILRSLSELGVIKQPERPSNRQEYLEMEEKMRKFSEKHGFDMDELDLLLWSMKTGEVLK